MMYSEKWLIEQYNSLSIFDRDKYAFVSIKIKHFRKLNRLYGRGYGDFLIKEVFNCILNCIGSEDYACHINLGYYNALLKLPENCKDDYSILTWISKLSNAITGMSDNRIQQQTFCGFGIYLLTKDLVDFHIAQYNADVARSQSNEKEFIISHVEIYGSSYIEEGLFAPDYRKMLPIALKKGHIKMYLQPKVDLFTGKITKAEALMRWIDPELGFLPIKEYLPILEECGQMNLIDRFIFEEACKIVLEWKKKYNKYISISVNVSKNTFVYPFFMKEFEEIHQKYPCEKSCIELELLESIIMNNLARVKEVTNEIIKAGYQCSLDDFGSGYSSYAVLTQVPFHTLKLDQSLFAFECNEKNKNMIKHIINFSHEIGLSIVAEGIESKDYITLLRQLKCDYIQGFIFYPGMAVEEFESRFLVNQESIKFEETKIL